jgi:anti-sigma B factor antagonist
MSEFSVHRKDMDEISVLNLDGYLDAHTAPSFEESLKQLVDEGRFKIIVNCDKLAYISSAGLGVFMGYIEDVRANNGDIKMSNMSEKVFKIFDLLGFPSLYEIVDEEGEAVDKFSNVNN